MDSMLEALSIAAVGGIAPGSILVILLLFETERSPITPLAYLLGYLLAYSMIGGLFIVGVDGLSPNFLEKIAFYFKAVLGSLFLLLALRVFINGRSGKNSKSPSFLSQISTLTPLGAMGFGFFIPMINIKSLAVFLSAVAAMRGVIETKIERLAWVVPLVVIFSASLFVPLILFILFPTHSNEFLGKLKSLLQTHGYKLATMILLLLGCHMLYSLV